MASIISIGTHPEGVREGVGIFVGITKDELRQLLNDDCHAEIITNISEGKNSLNEVTDKVKIVIFSGDSSTDLQNRLNYFFGKYSEDCRITGDPIPTFPLKGD